MEDKNSCSCKHHSLVPLLITLIGLAFLLEQAGVLTSATVAWAWPVLLTAIGLQKLFQGRCKCC